MSTPKRPGPAAYITLGALTTLAFVPLVVRTVASILNVSLGRGLNLTMFITLTVLMASAGALTATLIVRYFRACRAEDQAARAEREAELRAEIEHQRAEVDKLYQRMEEIEDAAWWTDPKTAPTEEDTVELGSNVVPFQRPSRWADRQSS